jgi:hypothetical protein
MCGANVRLGQNEPRHSLRRHGRSTSVSGPAGPAVGASESGQVRTLGSIMGSALACCPIWCVARPRRGASRDREVGCRKIRQVASG